jgi:DNA-binding MarR family transcriptional regulator
MAGRLQKELKKRGPFASTEQEVHLNLVRTADCLGIHFERLFRAYRLTPAQYNILRILRGEGAPLPILEIASRTVTVVPGITGLIDRLERAGMVRRERSTEDRRVVYVAITDLGQETLGRLDDPVLTLHRQLVGKLTRAEQRQLIQLLEKCRETCEGEDNKMT